MRRYLLIFFIFILLPVCTFAKPDLATSHLGSLTLSDRYLSICQLELPIYNVFGADYIPLYALGDAGFYVSYNASTNTSTVTKPSSSLLNAHPSAEKYWTTESLVDAHFQLFEGTIFVNGLQTHGVLAKDRVLIPIETLSTLGTLHTSSEDYFFTYAPQPFIQATAYTVDNQTDQEALILVSDLYWDSKWITRTNSYRLGAYQTLIRDVITPYGEKYISSNVTSYSTPTASEFKGDFNGQMNTPLFMRYDRASALGNLNALGDPITLDEAIIIEDTLRSYNFTSKTPYLVWTHIGTQRTYIFEERNGDWHLLKHFICSTGKNRTPTPKGEYELTRKVAYFGVEKGYRCKYAFGFIGTTYLYHSIVFDKTGSYLLEGKGVLGQQASEGCIRFSPENALWFYETLLPGTKVFIN